MKFACPHCRHECDFEEMQMDADLHAIIKLLLTFGPHANLVAAYIELFGILPLKTKRKKWRLLLEEMKRLFDSEEFTYQKRRYRISQAGIAEALNVVVHRHWDSHLENHNYLKKIMISIAEASTKEAGKHAEKDLRKREVRLRHPYCEYPYQEELVEPPTRVVHPSPSTGEGKSGGECLTDAQRAENMKRVGDILKKIGG